jgi:hypothetical protein
MRESRTYGSMRGARDETRVPTATDAFCCGALGRDWAQRYSQRPIGFTVDIEGTADTNGVSPRPTGVASDSKRSFGSIHATCLSALVTDRAMEAWYDPSIA